MSIRLQRLNELFRRDLGEIIQRNFQPDGCFVTITKVQLSPDLSIAKVYLSVFRQTVIPKQYIRIWMINKSRSNLS